VKSSKFKGVSWAKGAQKWIAKIFIDGKNKNLGNFDSEEAAARKYDEAASPLGRPLNLHGAPEQPGPVEAEITTLKGAPVISRVGLSTAPATLAAEATARHPHCAPPDPIGSVISRIYTSMAMAASPDVSILDLCLDGPRILDIIFDVP